MEYSGQAIRILRLIATGPAKLHFLLLAILLGGTVFAFPPAPHHLLYGIIRDEMGHPLSVPGAEVILESTTGAPIKAAIVPGLYPGTNYRLEIPMDAAVTLDRYKATALAATAPFKLRVRIGRAIYLPIEMTGEFSKLGEPAAATRLDLTLGEDSDGDGLPDAWERALIAGSGGKLTDVDPHGDLDRDGQSNLNEYLAGTYAFDREDGFSLKIVELKAGVSALEFMAVRGRSYSVFGSPDLNKWTAIPLRLAGEGATGAYREVFQAGESSVVRIVVPAAADQAAMRFFKLRVE